MSVTLNNSPQKKPNDIQAMRGSVLGQMHQGELQTHLRHPYLHKFIKTAAMLNLGGWICLFILFRIKNLFPPHEAPFMNAIGWYFFFGGIYAVFSFFFFKFAKFVEQQAVSRALTHNRRYEWHSQYDTKNITEEELKKIPEAHRQTTATQAVRAGANYFRITAILALASFATFGLGVYAFFGDFLG